MLRTTIQVPAEVFDANAAPSTRILPPNGTRVSLTFLRNNLKGDKPPDEDNFFPDHIFVREEMETTFRELIVRAKDTCIVFSGSPGIGKSILMFLVVLYQVVKKDVKAVCLRYVEDPTELVSKFVMQRQQDGSIDIQYTRDGSRSGNIPQEYDQLRGSFEGLRWSDRSILAAVDGPKADQITKYSALAYGCTSGAGIRIKHHMAATTFNVVMSAWKIDDLRAVVAEEYNLDLLETNQDSEKYFDHEKFDAVYFVYGGRIRGFLSAYKGKIDTNFADQVIGRISKSQGAFTFS